ncbi:MAG TPA: glycosyltransferase family 4 protein [Planctomycetota bacterium]|nr:glycosyltransferase family 4 protein [Planctomycetota bacterium]
MRVLLTSPVFPPDLGGPAVYVPSLGRFLVERGHDVRVVAFCSDPRPTGHPFPVRAVTRGNLAVRYLEAAWAVFREARHADVVYVNEHLALLHVFAARLAGKPVMIRIMVDGAWEISHRKGWIDGDDIVTFETKDYDWRVKCTRRLQQAWWGACTRIIACSDFLRRIPIDRYGVPEAKMQLVYNAYHGPTAAQFEETPAQARAELGLDEGKRYLLTICRLMVWKGVDYIIDALRELPDDVNLLVAGDGDMLEPWKAHARERGLAARVHFLGNVPFVKIPLYIRAAEAFVLNSEYEGLSHTLLEVSALGTPIVATGVCGNPEVVEHGTNGLLVPPRDAQALAAALRRLLDDPALRRRFVEAGLARMDRFGRERTFGQVERALAEVAGVELEPAPAS